MPLDKKPLAGAVKSAAKAASTAKPAAKTAATAKPAAKAAATVKQATAKATDAVGEVNKNTRNEMFKKVCALIPGKVDNKLVVNAFELMRKEQKLVKKDFSVHLKANAAAFKKHAENLKKGYIEDQNSYTDMKYGESTVQYSGCEVIATFNALANILGSKGPGLHELVNEYEKDGMILSGKFGTSPKAAMDLVKKYGLKSELATEEEDFDKIGKNYDSMILTMYNDKNDISKEVHTINISKDAGKFTAHNVYCNGKSVGPYATVTEVIKNINGGKAKGISLIGIKK